MPGMMREVMSSACPMLACPNRLMFIFINQRVVGVVPLKCTEVDVNVGPRPL
jgi:hypothetical protein